MCVQQSCFDRPTTPDVDMHAASITSCSRDFPIEKDDPSKHEAGVTTLTREFPAVSNADGFLRAAHGWPP